VGQEKPLTQQTDETLVEKCRSKDHYAFAELVDRYKDKVHWVVRRMVGSSDDEDVTQEVFVRAYQALPNFRGDSSFSTWIYRIARNLCLSELRKRERCGEHLSLSEESEEEVHWLLRESGENLEEELERRDLSRNVQQLLGELPEYYCTALTLFYLNQAKYEEIAEIMEVPVNTVKTYIYRAKLRLRNRILAESDLAGLACKESAALGEGREANGLL